MRRIIAGALSILAILVGTLIFAGCGEAEAPPVPVTVTTTRLVTVTVTKSQTMAPKLVNLSVSLAIKPPAEYAAYPVPIFMRTDQTLHFNWKVEGGPFYINVTTPSGKIISVDSSSVVLTENAEALQYLGVFTFSPGDEAFQESEFGGSGYYYFVPSITKENPPVKIAISYWIEDN